MRRTLERLCNCWVVHEFLGDRLTTNDDRRVEVFDGAAEGLRQKCRSPKGTVAADAAFSKRSHERDEHGRAAYLRTSQRKSSGFSNRTAETNGHGHVISYDPCDVRHRAECEQRSQVAGIRTWRGNDDDLGQAEAFHHLLLEFRVGARVGGNSDLHQARLTCLLHHPSYLHTREAETVCRLLMRETEFEVQSCDPRHEVRWLNSVLSHFVITHASFDFLTIAHHTIDLIFPQSFPASLARTSSFGPRILSPVPRRYPRC